MKTGLPDELKRRMMAMDGRGRTIQRIETFGNINGLNGALIKLAGRPYIAFKISYERYVDIRPQEGMFVQVNKDGVIFHDSRTGNSVTVPYGELADEHNQLPEAIPA